MCLEMKLEEVVVLDREVNGAHPAVKESQDQLDSVDLQAWMAVVGSTTYADGCLPVL